MSSAKQPDDVDRYVGQQVRQARREQNLTQQQVGDLLDITFQQVQKYEKGVNRISAGRLLKFGEALDRPIGFFYPASASNMSIDSKAARSLEVSDLQKNIKRDVEKINDVENLRALARLTLLASA